METEQWLVCLKIKCTTSSQLDAGKVQGSVTETRTTMEANIRGTQRNIRGTQRNIRGTQRNTEGQNDLVIYNLKEDVTNSKSVDKELVVKTPEKVTSKNMDKEIIEIFRIGTKYENASKP